jgi:hypothetical protein
MKPFPRVVLLILAWTTDSPGAELAASHSHLGQLDLGWIGEPVEIIIKGAFPSVGDLSLRQALLGSMEPTSAFAR